MHQEKQQVVVGASGYSTQIVRSADQFSRLSQEAWYLLAEQSSTCDPRFYFASVQRTIWIPLAVVVKYAGSTVGIVYTKERKVAGLPLGLIYADATLGSMVVAEPAHREPVLEAALHELIDRGSRGLRLLIPSAGIEHKVIQRFLDSRRLDIRHVDVEHHCVLELGSSYDAFLEKLSKKTRRNFRYHRRRFEALGHTYVEKVPSDEFQRAAFDLLEKDVVGADRDGINRALGMLATVKNPILVGLRHHDGEWFSILGGWHEGDYCIVFFQMNNDRDYPHSDLCIVLRGCLIEAMIAAEVPSMLFWDGVGPPLRRYCWTLPCVGVHLDVPSFGWRTLRRLIRYAAVFLPANLRVMANWVAPEAPPQKTNIV